MIYPCFEQFSILLFYYLIKKAYLIVSVLYTLQQLCATNVVVYAVRSHQLSLALTSIGSSLNTIEKTLVSTYIYSFLPKSSRAPHLQNTLFPSVKCSNRKLFIEHFRTLLHNEASKMSTGNASLLRLPPPFRLPSISQESFNIPADGSPLDPTKEPDYYTPYNMRNYHQYNPWYSPYKWSDGRVYRRSENDTCESQYGYSPPRPLRERDLAYPSVPFGWRVFSAIALDKVGWKWRVFVREPLHLKQLVWARLSTRLCRATAKMLTEYALKDPYTYSTNGNIFIFTAPTLHHALQFLKSNPFMQAGLYKKLLLYEHEDKTQEHPLLGHELTEDTCQFLIYGEDKLFDTVNDKHSAKLRSMLEEKHLRFLCRSNNVYKRAYLRAPRRDTIRDLKRSTKQLLPILEEQIKRLYQQHPPSQENEMYLQTLPIAEMTIINSNNKESALEWATRAPFTRGGLWRSLYVAQINELDFYGKCSTLVIPSAGTVPIEADAPEYYSTERDDVERLIKTTMNVTEDASLELDAEFYGEFLKDWAWINLPKGEYWSGGFMVSGEKETMDIDDPAYYNAYAANREPENFRQYSPGFWLYKPESKILFNDTTSGALVFGAGIDKTFSWNKTVDPAILTQTMIDFEISKEQTRQGHDLIWDKHWPPVTANPNFQSRQETEEELRTKWGLPHWDLPPESQSIEDYTPTGMEFLNEHKLKGRHPDYQRLMEHPDIVHNIHSHFLERLDKGEATLKDDPFRYDSFKTENISDIALPSQSAPPTMQLWDNE